MIAVRKQEVSASSLVCVPHPATTSDWVDADFKYWGHLYLKCPLWFLWVLCKHSFLALSYIRKKWEVCGVVLLVGIRAVVPSLFGTRYQFCGRQFFHVTRGGGRVLGWFKYVTFIVCFISNLMLLLIWQVWVPEVGDPCIRAWGAFMFPLLSGNYLN